MLIISLDTSKVEAAFDSMLKRIEHFPSDMADELTEWQVEDMHRRYPNIEMPDEKTVETDIWPRSRKPDTGRYVRVTQRAAKNVRRVPLVRRRVASTRPILRPELFEKLCDRMDALMQDKLGWITSRSSKDTE